MSDNEIWAKALKRLGTYVYVNDTGKTKPSKGLVYSTIEKISMSVYLNRGSDMHGKYMPAEVVYIIDGVSYREREVAFTVDEIEKIAAK